MICLSYLKWVDYKHFTLNKLRMCVSLIDFLFKKWLKREKGIRVFILDMLWIWTYTKMKCWLEEDKKEKLNQKRSHTF